MITLCGKCYIKVLQQINMIWEKRLGWFCKGNGTVEEDDETERTATRAIAAAVVGQKQHEEVYLHNAAQLAAGIANRDLYAIAGRIPEVASCHHLSE